MSGKVHVMDHPLVAHKLTILRDKDTSVKDFREIVSEIGMLITYEATRDLPLTEKEVETPICKTTAPTLKGKKFAVVPILRAGLGVLKHTPTGKYTVDISAEIPDHSVGIQMALDALTNEEYGVIDSMDEIDAVGHRVVHGGERFTDSVLISDDVLNGIEACAEIAPLHNPPNLYGIKACMRLMYNTPQVAVFDTAFHQTMPKVAYLYGLPYEMYVI